MDLPLQYDTIMNMLNYLLILIEVQTSSITPILSHKLYPKTYMHTLVMYVCMYVYIHNYIYIHYIILRA